MSEKFDAGLAVRREVMSDEFVDRAFANADEFTMPLQAMITENAWGEVWTRDGLSRRERSLVTIAMLTALKAPQELKGHVRGALRNGCSVREIQEVLLQSVVYCGAPAAQEAFRAAAEVIKAFESAQEQE
jgi:4-carboxymuconolactone decarboxylase